MVLGFFVILPASWDQAQNLAKEMPRMLKEGNDVLLLLPERYPTLLSDAQVNDFINVIRVRAGEAGQSILSFSSDSDTYHYCDTDLCGACPDFSVLFP